MMTNAERHKKLEGLPMYYDTLKKMLDTLKPYASSEQLKEITKLQEEAQKNKEWIEAILSEKTISEQCFIVQSNEYGNLNEKVKILIEGFLSIIRDNFSDTLTMAKLGFGLL